MKCDAQVFEPRRVTKLLRRYFRSIRHATTRTNMQQRLTPTWQIAQLLSVGHKLAPTPLGEQHDEIDGGEAHATHDDVNAGHHPVEVDVGSECRWHIAEALSLGEISKLLRLRRGLRPVVSDRVQHEISFERGS
ncbi:hypothetical protein [Leucobacter sp. W1478]|uniref:hypothetical protein n=1 Tax=Leucobacter sp. W1478 TaxID=3439065 RepID=UPI003F3485EA